MLRLGLKGSVPESLSSAEEERVDSLTSVIDLITKYHTLGKPTLTVLVGPPVSPGRAEVPAGALPLRASEPSRWGHPYGSRLHFCVRS